MKIMRIFTKAIERLIKNKKNLKKFLLGLTSVCFLILIVLFSSQDKKENIHSEKIESKESDNSRVEKYKTDNVQQDSVNKNIVKKETRDLKKKSEIKKIPQKKKPKVTVQPKKKIELNDRKEPIENIEELHNGLKTISSKSSLGKIIKLIENTYRVEKMLSLIVGKEWSNVNNQQKIELKNVFTEYIAKNYIRRFGKIKNFNFSITTKKNVGKNYRMVKTFLTLENEKISINYLLNQKDNQWKIFDVLLAGSVSEIATKKSEFSSFISKNKVESLIQAIRNKNLTLLK